jgi:hypothetical protein
VGGGSAFQRAERRLRVFREARREAEQFSVLKRFEAMALALPVDVARKRRALASCGTVSGASPAK